MSWNLGLRNQEEQKLSQKAAAALEPWRSCGYGSSSRIYIYIAAAPCAQSHIPHQATQHCCSFLSGCGLMIGNIDSQSRDTVETLLHSGNCGGSHWAVGSSCCWERGTAWREDRLFIVACVERFWGELGVWVGMAFFCSLWGFTPLSVSLWRREERADKFPFRGLCKFFCLVVRASDVCVTLGGVRCWYCSLT